MSRIGRMPVVLPKGVTIEQDGNRVTVQGPRGSLTREFRPEMRITQDGARVTVERDSDSREVRALHGLTRALLANMVTGVTQGFRKNLVIEGVGYRAEQQGKNLSLQVGFSHAVPVVPPEGIRFSTDNGGRTITIEGNDKELVGEIAAQRLGRKGMPVMLYMGAKHKEQVERIHKDNLARQGVRIVATDEKEKSPFALLEGIGFLREGGIVSMTGDRLWGEQTSVTVNFLGHETRLPDTPHLFALMSGAPLMTFFVHQDESGIHQIRLSPGRKVLAKTRAQRHQAVAASAQAYADDLARFVVEHPFEWHHFEPFLGKKIEAGTE